MITIACTHQINSIGVGPIYDAVVREETLAGGTTVITFHHAWESTPASFQMGGDPWVVASVPEPSSFLFMLLLGSTVAYRTWLSRLSRLSARRQIVRLGP